MNVICIGAHPDDAEVHAGGAMVKWARAGHRVWFDPAIVVRFGVHVDYDNSHKS